MSKITLSFMQRFMTNLDSAIKTYVGAKVTAINKQLTTQKGVEIPAHTDLNDMKTAGVYYIKSDSVASGLSNLPLEKCGRIFVEDNHANGLLQIYTPNHSPRIFQRVYWSSSWTEWVEYAPKSLLLPQCTINNDGTYVLKATVSNGVVIYTWVSEV